MCKSVYKEKKNIYIYNVRSFHEAINKMKMFAHQKIIKSKLDEDVTFKR